MPLDDIKLSDHFGLGELCRTSHREIDNVPPAEVIERLCRLANDFLEPIRLKFGPLWITSGYRCEALNRAIGGSKNSAHTYGCAADFVPLAPGVRTQDIVKWVAGPSGLLFDQVIDEYSSTSNWVHLGMLRPNAVPPPRRDVLAFKGGVYRLFDFA